MMSETDYQLLDRKMTTDKEVCDTIFAEMKSKNVETEKRYEKELDTLKTVHQALVQELKQKIQVLEDDLKLERRNHHAIVNTAIQNSNASEMKTQENMKSALATMRVQAYSAAYKQMHEIVQQSHQNLSMLLPPTAPDGSARKDEQTLIQFLVR
jgi:hypothetical protein